MRSTAEGKQRGGVIVTRNLNPIALKAIPAPVSHGVAVTGPRTVYVSGQVAVDRGGNLVGAGDVAAQTHQVMRNIQTILAEARTEFSDVVKLTMYLTREGDLPTVIGVRSEYLGQNRQAATAVTVRALARPEFLIEIEAIAVAD